MKDLNEVAAELLAEKMDAITHALVLHTEMASEDRELLTAEELSRKLKMTKQTILIHKKAYDNYPHVKIACSDYRFIYSEVVEWYRTYGEGLRPSKELQQAISNGETIKIAGIIPTVVGYGKVQQGQQKKRGRKLRSAVA